MVSLKAIRTSLPDFRNHTGLVAVFLGGTSGIGEATVRALAKNVDLAKIYIIGRNAAAAERIIGDCKQLSPSSEFRFIQQDVALIRDVDEVARRIKEQEDKVDILFMTPDYIDFGPRKETAERIDVLLSLRYYARMRLTVDLLPLLSAAPCPRVISILAPWYCEFNICLDDLALENHHGVILNFSQASLMTTLFFEELAIRNPKVSFVHAFPGIIWTPSVQTAHISPMRKLFIWWVIRPLLWFWSQSLEECGDRMLFLCGNHMMPPREDPDMPPRNDSDQDTVGLLGRGLLMPRRGNQRVLFGSDGEIGSGCYCVDSGAQGLGNSWMLKRLRKKGAREKIWEHTMGIFSQVESSVP